MADDYVKRIRTNTGDKQIDYNALANLPDLTKVGTIEVSEPVVGDFSNIPMYDKDGNATTDFGNAHSGIFKVYLQQSSGSAVVQYGNKYVFMEQTVAQTPGQEAYSITQTILNGDELQTRNFTSSDIFFPDDEGILSYGDFNCIELASVANKEDVANKSSVIDDTADDIKYPSTKAVKDYVDNSIPFEKDLSTFEPINIIEGMEIGLEVGKSWMSGSFTTHGGKPYSNQYTSGYTAFSEAIDVMEGHTYLIPSFVGTVDLYGDGASHTRILSQGSIKNAEFTVPEGMNKMGVSYRHEYISTPTAIYRTSLTEEETENIAICSENFSLLPKNLKNKEAISLLAPLKGKTIVNFGDSIFGNARPPQDVSTYIAELTGATVHNCAFGGCRMAQHVGHYDAFSMYRLAYAIANNDYSVQDEAIAYSDRTSYAEEPLALLKSIDFSKVDIITIAYGTNDWTGLGKEPDHPTDLYNTTYFGGALRYSIETLLNAYPNLKIFLCCPTYRFWVDSDNVFTEDSDTRLESNHTLIEYIECMQEIAKSYHLPFIDNYYSLGINKYNRSLYFSANDGAHHLEPGRRLIASHIAKHLF